MNFVVAAMICANRMIGGHCGHSLGRCRESERDVSDDAASAWFVVAGGFLEMTMHKMMMLALAGVMALGVSAAVAQDAAPPKKPMVAVIGQVSAVTPTEVDITGKDGTKTAIALGAKTRFTWTSPLKIEDIKVGSYIGAGAMKDGKGGNTAVEITVFPESARGTAEGFSQWNLGPDSTMTNGTVSQVVGSSNKVLTVTYKGGQQSVTLSDTTPVTTFEMADATALTVGANVVVRAVKNDDGTLTAGFVSVGKDGFVPG
jgi:hypothetical protein